MYPYVRNLVRRSIGDTPQWEDVVQEVYVSCLSTLERVGFNGKSSFKTWLYQVIMRRVYDSLRQSYRVMTAVFMESYVNAEHCPAPDEIFQEVETREKIESGFFVLSPQEKRVFDLLLNDWEIREIAYVMKISISRVGQARSSGLQKMRKLYGVKNGNKTNNNRSKRLGY